MREIKFRAWDKHIGEMIYCDPLHLGDYLCDKDNVMMQFTGLLDKNGKEIWEGDVVRWNSSRLGSQSAIERPLINSEVIFDKGAWYFKGNEIWNLAIYSNIEVIGNIYENPELIPHHE